MLGKLAKWLRILGYNTLYFKKIEPKELVKIAKSEKRIILTRNSHLSEFIKPDKFIYINSLIINEQLKQVISSLNLNTKSGLFSICTICNEKVRKIKKENIKEKVPPYVFQENSIFYICPKCKRLYWMGSHYHNTIKNIENLIKEI